MLPIDKSLGKIQLIYWKTLIYIYIYIYIYMTQGVFTRMWHKAYLLRCDTKDIYKDVTQGMFTKMWHKPYSQGCDPRHVHKDVTQGMFTRMWPKACSQVWDTKNNRSVCNSYIVGCNRINLYCQ